MKPKDKAKELVDKFSLVGLQQRNEGIECALIAVDEIISIAYWEWMDSGGGEEKNYWQQVKQEIEKL